MQCILCSVNFLKQLPTVAENNAIGAVRVINSQSKSCMLEKTNKRRVSELRQTAESGDASIWFMGECRKSTRDFVVWLHHISVEQSL